MGGLLPSYLRAAASLLTCMLCIQTTPLAQPALAPGPPFLNPTDSSASLPATLKPTVATAPVDVDAGGAALISPVSTMADAPGMTAPEAASAASQEPALVPADFEAFQTPCQQDYMPPRTPDPQLCNSTYSVGVGFDGNSGPNGASGCIWEQWTNYYVDPPAMNNLQFVTKIQSASACCDLCAQTPLNTSANTMDRADRQCNIWAWCGEPTGCCKAKEGCRQDQPLNNTNMLPYQTCVIKFWSGYSTSQGYINNPPPQWYGAQDVSSWPDWQVQGKNVTSRCKAFTSGVVLDWLHNKFADIQTAPDDNLIALPGVDIPYFDYSCSQKLHPQRNMDTTQAEFCYVPGTIEASGAECVKDQSCSGLVQLDWASTDNITGWAYLKRFPDALKLWNKSEGPYPDCVSIRPFATTYMYTNHSAFSVQPQVGAIAGGVVGGAVGLAALAVALACFLHIAKRRRKSRHTEVSEQSQYQLPRLSESLHTPVLGRPVASSRRLFAISPAEKQSPGTYTARWCGISGQRPRMPTDSSDESWLEMSKSAMDHPYAASTILRSMAQGQEYEEWGISPDELQIAKNDSGADVVLGAGAFGVVYKALLGGSGAVAVKLIKGHQDVRAQMQFLREIELLKIARHPNIVMYMGACISDGRTLLVTEFMAGGDLYSKLGQEDPAFTWYKRGKMVALDIAQGLQYLHSHFVLHLDIKSGNVLLHRDGTAKISDVGLARVMKHSQYTRPDAQGTWAWAAPEVIMGEQCTPKADVYSYGVLLWEIVSAEIPTRGDRRRIRVPEEAPQEIDHLIQRCTRPDPQDRPDMREIIDILSID